MFDGVWDGVIVATYGADLEFCEGVLLRQLSRTKHRVVFCDGRQVARILSDLDSRTQLRQVNRTYVLAPIRASRAAHAKLIMLLGHDRGLLTVGSGNLSMSGYASQGECFSTYHWTDEDAGYLGEFLAARDFIDQMWKQGLVDPVVGEFVTQVWQDAPWLYGKAQQSDSLVRHNLKRSLLDQFVDAIGGRGVDELIVHAPFYDRRCRALEELVRRTSPRTLKVLLQERLTSVDPGRLASVVAGALGRVDIRSVTAPDKGTLLHAKFLIAKCENMAICLQGSPNISSPALLRTHSKGNIELANLLVGDRRDFDHLIASLIVSPDPVDVFQLGLSLASDGDDGQLSRSVAAELCWVDPDLSGTFDRETRVPPQLSIDGGPVTEATWALSEPSDGTTRFTVRLGEEAAAALNRVAAVSFVFENGDESLPSFPYHRNTLMSLVSGEGRTDLLKRAGDFEIGDEELEGLLAQLDEALIVDGLSIWRMRKRKVPAATEGETSVSIAYEELDWGRDPVASQTGAVPKLGSTFVLKSNCSRDTAHLDISATPSHRATKPLGCIGVRRS